MFTRICCPTFHLLRSHSITVEGLFSNKSIFSKKNAAKFWYSSFAPKLPAQETFASDQDNLITNDTMALVNEQIGKGKENRLFAVVHLCGKQFKVTAEDIIIVEGYWPPRNKDKIKLDKVLLVGGRDFTLVGRPLVAPDIVSVTATVIEKDLSHTKTIFFKRRRKQYMRINFFRSQMTMLRINEVAVTGKINEDSLMPQNKN